MTSLVRSHRIAQGLILALATMLALPHAARAGDIQLDKMRAKIAAFVDGQMAKLGGSRLVYKVDADGLRETVIADVRDDVYKILRDDKIAFSGLTVRDGGVELKVPDAKSRAQIVRKLEAAAEGAPSHALAVTDGDGGELRLMPTDTASAARLRELVEDGIGIIEQRLKDAGIELASVQPDGADRIRLFVPGEMEPERLVAILARKVKVGFRLVDSAMRAEQAEAAGPPPGSEVLFGFKDKRPYLVAKDTVIEGSDISSAAPSLDSRTKEAIASFRFNGRGTRRFARITTENVGRAFAIVVDDKVVSAPVIREPITGGSGQISGNFTLEEANSVAMMLRAGSLPGHLALVEQRVLQPAGRP